MPDLEAISALSIQDNLGFSSERPSQANRLFTLGKFASPAFPRNFCLPEGSNTGKLPRSPPYPIPPGQVGSLFLSWWAETLCCVLKWAEPRMRQGEYPGHSPDVGSESQSPQFLQSCLPLCNAMDCSPPGSSAHGIFQARILEWVAISFSRGSSQPRDRTHVFCIADRLLLLPHLGRPWIVALRCMFLDHQGSGV